MVKTAFLPGPTLLSYFDSTPMCTRLPLFNIVLPDNHTGFFLYILRIFHVI